MRAYPDDLLVADKDAHMLGTSRPWPEHPVRVG